jgi:hypothetical protein
LARAVRGDGVYSGVTVRVRLVSAVVQIDLIGSVRETVVLFTGRGVDRKGFAAAARLAAERLRIETLRVRTSAYAA